MQLVLLWALLDACMECLCKGRATSRFARTLALVPAPQHPPAATLTHQPQCKFNHDVDYMQDEALVEKLKSLSDFLELKAFLVEVLEPPPPPSKKKDGRASALKRKVSAGRVTWDFTRQRCTSSRAVQILASACVLLVCHAAPRCACAHVGGLCAPTLLLCSGLTVAGQAASGCTGCRATRLGSCLPKTT